MAGLSALIVIGPASGAQAGSGTSGTTFTAPYPTAQVRYYEGTSGTPVTPDPAVASANAGTGAIHLGLQSDSSKCQVLPSAPDPFPAVNCIEGVRDAHVGFAGMSVSPRSQGPLTVTATLHVASAAWSKTTGVPILYGRAFAEAAVQASGTGLASTSATYCPATVVDDDQSPGPDTRSNQDLVIRCGITANGKGTIKLAFDLEGYVAPGWKYDNRLDIDATLSKLVVR